MKKLFLLLFLIPNLAVSYGGVKWEVVTYKDGVIASYVEVNSIQKVGKNKRQFWVYANLPIKNGKKISASSLYEADCVKKTFKELVTTYFNKYDLKGNAIFNDTKPSPLKHARPGSHNHNVINFACKN